MLFLQLLKDHFVDENRRLLFIHSTEKDWSTQKDEKELNMVKLGGGNDQERCQN